MGTGPRRQPDNTTGSDDETIIPDSESNHHRKMHFRRGKCKKVFSLPRLVLCYDRRNEDNHALSGRHGWRPRPADPCLIKEETK